MTEFYRQEDVQQILQLAIARQVHGEDLSRAQLLEIAAELDISPDNLRAAEQEWLVRRKEVQERQIFNTYRQERLQQHLVKYTITNIFLILLDFLTTGGFSWSLYVLLIWGVGLALHAWQTYRTKGDRYEEQFQKWYRRRLLKKTVNNFLNRWLKA